MPTSSGLLSFPVLAICAGLIAAPLMPAYAQTSREAAALSLQIQRLETRLRQMTGQMEEMGYRMEQMEKRFKRFSEDTEYRFQELKAGKGKPRKPRVKPRQQPRPYTPGNSGRATPPPPPEGLALDDVRSSTVRSLGSVPGSALDLELNPGGSMLDEPAPVQMSARESYDHAYGLILRRDYEGAQKAFSRFLEVHGTSGLAGNAQYWLGESFYARQQYRRAADAFLAGYTKYSRSSKAPGSLLKLGMTLFRLGQKNAGCASLGELSRKFPKASKAIKTRAARERRRAGC